MNLPQFNPFSCWWTFGVVSGVLAITTGAALNILGQILWTRFSFHSRYSPRSTIAGPWCGHVFVTLKSERPGFEFFCLTHYFLSLRQFTFLLFSCKMGIPYPISQGSMKKTDDFLAISRSR